jgi:hypothetical protein
MLALTVTFAVVCAVADEIPESSGMSTSPVASKVTGILLLENNMKFFLLKVIEKTNRRFDFFIFRLL